MKILSIFGVTQSGKTTTVEGIIRELTKRRYRVDSVKEIHFEEFKIDLEGSNTDRHKKAGAEIVTARGFFETDVLYNGKLPMEKIFRMYDSDYLICEGVTDANVQKIICAHSTQEVDERLDDSVIALAGRLGNTMTEYRGLPVFNVEQDLEKLVDFIEEKIVEKLPDFPEDCCDACGHGGCRGLLAAINRGEAKRGECILDKKAVRLYVDGQEIEMVPFVQRIVRNSVLSSVSELDGYRKNGKIEVVLNGDDVQ
ncbi:molybdopterin-guanine dinucleotide biosynthesis protein MobB [Clostridia bacterium]|nr:molybdopterin-guanine dinucleotide biosynthesis protein MobB [Clostridia bacterium]